MVVDGVDVAFTYGGKKLLSPRGIALAVAQFCEMSMPVRVSVIRQRHPMAHRKELPFFPGLGSVRRCVFESPSILLLVEVSAWGLTI